MYLLWVCRSKKRREFRGGIASRDGFTAVPLRRVGLLTVDAQCPPWIVWTRIQSQTRTITGADRQMLTFSITEKDVGRAHVPAPVLVDGSNIWLTRVHAIERPITPVLFLRKRVIRRLDVYRIVWIRDLVKPELGTILPRPRVLQKPSWFSSGSVEPEEERRRTASVGSSSPPPPKIAS